MFLSAKQKVQTRLEEVIEQHKEYSSAYHLREKLASEGIVNELKEL